MKKLLMICCLLAFSKSFSQGLLKRFDVGVKGGANYSNFTDAPFATDPLIGFHGGATIAFKITKNFLIQEEFLVSAQGAKSKETVFGAQDIKLSYLSVPFLLKFRTNSGIYLEAGPQFSYKLDEKVAGLSTGDFAKKVDLAAAGGIGFQSKSGLGIGARYVYGLSEVGDFASSTPRKDFKNNVVQASLFYVF